MVSEGVGISEIEDAILALVCFTGFAAGIFGLQRRKILVTFRLLAFGACLFLCAVTHAIGNTVGGGVGKPASLLLLAATAALFAAERVRNLNDRWQRRVAARTSEMQSAVRELESFSYTVSHDLRAPLRAIQGFARIVDDECSQEMSPQGRRYLGVIRQSASQMGALIDDLLRLARVGQQKLQWCPIDMEELVAEIIDDFRKSGRIAEENGAIVARPLPRAFADRALVKAVLIQLLSNAVKFSSKKGRVDIEIRGESHPVEDFEGTGVGLAIVQRVVTRHGGKAWAEGTPNEGASFYFALPRQNEPFA